MCASSVPPFKVVDQRALAGSDDDPRLSARLELAGVGVPTASALLYFALACGRSSPVGAGPRPRDPVSFSLGAYTTAAGSPAATE